MVEQKYKINVSGSYLQKRGEDFTYKGTVSSRVGNQGLLVESESNGLRMTRGGFLPSGPAECYAIVS